jgi:GT2 family glycosyltransferase
VISRAASDELPRVDVVIPLFRPRRWLEACVDSVLLNRDVDLLIWLIDDDPASSLGPVVAERWPNVHYMLLSRNLGFAAASNMGIGLGTAPYVLTLNQDARLDPDYLACLVASMSSDPRVGAAGGILRHQADPDRPPDGTIDSAGIEFRRGRRAVDIGQGDAIRGQYAGLREVFGVCAAAAFYRRSALESVRDPHGIFDERFYMHKEDVDLAWRLRRAGFRALVDDRARAYHARGVHRASDVPLTGPRSAVRAVRWLFRQERAKAPDLRRRAFRNQMLMLIKNENVSDLARSLPDIAFVLTAQTVISAMLDPIGTVAGRADLVRRLPGAFRARRSAPVQGSVARWLP